MRANDGTPITGRGNGYYDLIPDDNSGIGYAYYVAGDAFDGDLSEWTEASAGSTWSIVGGELNVTTTDNTPYTKFLRYITPSLVKGNSYSIDRKSVV